MNLYFNNKDQKKMEINLKGQAEICKYGMLNQINNYKVSEIRYAWISAN